MRQFPQVAKETMEEMLAGRDPRAKRLSSGVSKEQMRSKTPAAKKGTKFHKYISKYTTRIR